MKHGSISEKHYQAKALEGAKQEKKAKSDKEALERQETERLLRLFLQEESRAMKAKIGKTLRERVPDLDKALEGAREKYGM